MVILFGSSMTWTEVLRTLSSTDRGSNSCPPYHGSSFYVTETPVLTNRPSVTFKKVIFKYIVGITQFICILESQVVECSMGRFYTYILQYAQLIGEKSL